MMRKFQQHSFGSTCKRLLSLFAIVLFLLTFVPEVVESRRGGFGGGRSFSRSSSRSSSSRSYSTPKRSTSSSSSRSSYTKPRSTGSSYSGNRTTGTTSTRNSTTARQKQTATNRAKTTNTTSTRNSTATRSQQGRKQVRQLKAENRSLKRKVTTANRQTSQARRQQRSTITVNNFGGYYPMTGYSMYSLQRSMMFNNLLFGIYFHDYYNHSIRHSYLWHYHHRDYDRSHWDAKKQAEYEHYKEYYENQGVEANANYVDPDTNRDEDFAATYVEENPDKFYGDNVEVVTVDELPDEAALKQELIASAETPTVTTNTQRAPPSQRIIVEKSTSGGTWFVLIFGGLLIVGGIMLVMYNKGYF
jgi:hypothetical protein